MIFANCASALSFASFLAAVFSSSVKSVRLSISLFLSSNAFAIAFLASAFATGVTFATAVVPSALALSTAAFVVAASTAPLATSACAFANSFALVFSSGVKSVRASISWFLASNALSIAFLASGLALATGSTAVSYTHLTLPTKRIV